VYSIDIKVKERPMMNREQMIQEVEQTHRSRPGYSFDPAKIVEAIDGGIPEGAVLTVRAGQVVKYESGHMVVYVDGTETKRVKMNAEQAEQALMAYAFNYSKQGREMMGSM
jgi:hypothetical protein